jgi:hypothetical protein
VSALVTALGDVLAALAVQPGLTRLFPGLAAAPADAALAQWAACATLGGRGVRDLGSDAISGALPWAPEFCAWAVSVMGVPLADARLPLDGAATFLATLRSSAHSTRPCAAVQPRALTRHGRACVWLRFPFLCFRSSDPAFAEQMTHFPPATLAPVLNVTEPHARLLLGCVRSCNVCEEREACRLCTRGS